jgi:tetratricopeptide (TPR) repeat protein
LQFDPDNHVMKLCAEGMGLEGKGQPGEAYKLFQQAWNESTNDLEKFTAAHYVARHQNSVEDKLKWDKMALDLALKINDQDMVGSFPSLYLNIAKCHEDLNNYAEAKKNYQLALSYTNYLPEDGYGKMIKSGIISGIERVGG